MTRTGSKQQQRFVDSSESVEWYTPAPYVEAARTVLERIDLDPASCAKANETIKAGQYFTVADDGLSKPWTINGSPASVFCNPPYGYTGGTVNGEWSGRAGRPNQDVWTEYLLKQYRLHNVYSAIWLLTAATDATRFKELFPFLVCLTDHRIKFVGPDGKTVSGNTKGSAFVYLPPFDATEYGRKWYNDLFARTFSQFGNVVTLYKDQLHRHRRR